MTTNKGNIMLRILNDTHLGNNAVSHTDGGSGKALDKAIYESALKASKAEDKFVLHAGDLFHRFSNKESVILQGLFIAENCDLIVGANHDLSNRKDVESSISIVNEVLDNVIMAEVDEVICKEFSSNGVSFTVIPHHSSQDLFDEAVKKAKGGDLIFLHCNYNSPFAHNDASLNLSVEQATELLKAYDYIVLAHEHNHRWELDGRLLVTGNTHPTNFGDISDKFYWDYNKECGFTPTKIWDKSTGYLKLNVSKLLEGFKLPESVNFIEISGSNVDPKLTPEISKAMRQLWKENTGNLYMIRNNVEYQQFSVETVDKKVQLEDVTKDISEKLKGSDLESLWSKHLSEQLN